MLVVSLLLMYLRASGEATYQGLGPGWESDHQLTSERESSATLTTSSDYISVCSQHPALCPVNGDTWAGEPDAWRKTGKKWITDPNTPDSPHSINVMWEFSFPYQGPNPDYLGQQDNPYLDYSNTPDGWPTITGTAPYVFEWERWDRVGDNYIMHQYAGQSELTSRFVGTDDCESGTYYPVVDHSNPYTYSPMSVLRQGYCAQGGYMVARLIETWGAPRSLQRLVHCDNELNGIPSAVTPLGAAACYHSPYVGTVYQGYAWGPGDHPNDKPVLGCEAAVYAWGWSEPDGPANLGQDWEAWFRNGELRLSAWYKLSNRSAVVPPPDSKWWDDGCAEAWSESKNWLYAGKFQIGEAVYTDTLQVVPKVSAELASEGGQLTSSLDATSYQFPQGVFTQSVTVVHTVLMEDSAANAGPQVRTNHVFELEAFETATGAAVVPGAPFTITIGYGDAPIADPIGERMALYFWDGGEWVIEPNAIILPELVVVRASLSRLGRFALLVEPLKTLIPSVSR
jgi:hypothetical protein